MSIFCLFCLAAGMFVVQGVAEGKDAEQITKDLAIESNPVSAGLKTVTEMEAVKGIERMSNERNQQVHDILNDPDAYMRSQIRE